MNVAKGIIAGVGVASLLVALPATAGSKHEASSSGSATTDHAGTAGSQDSQSGMMGGGMMGGTAERGATSAAGQQMITGKVEKVDEAKNQLTLQLNVDPQTQVLKDGKTASLADIKEGDEVRASFSGSQVQRIEVLSSGMAPSGGGGPSSTTPSTPGTTAPPAPGGGSSERGY